MDLPTILIKTTGAALLLWTVFSIFKHLREKKRVTVLAKKENTQSVSEQTLNTILLYVWYAFMFVFSIGMIVNN